MIEIAFPDGKKNKYSLGITPLEIATSISSSLAREVLSASLDGEVIELTTPITKDSKLVLYTFEDKLGKKSFWHSSAHIMAQALEEIYPGIKLTIGPAIDTGFYYDVDTINHVIHEKDFPIIEKKFLELARKKAPFNIRIVSKEEAIKKYTYQTYNEYKLELINDLEDGTISLCTHDDFTDLCRGGHIPHTGKVKAFKLMNVAGAYWRGDQSNKQLTRVYGISFPKQKMLDEYLLMLEEAKKYDHRNLGRDLDLFCFSEKVGQGLPLWMPKGAALRNRLENFMREAQTKMGYQPVYTPHIGHKSLYETSGHYEKYGEDSFRPITTPHEGEIFMLKPMNCPHHCEIYNATQHSYKDLPVRYAEFGTVYRYEKSGELHGLLRVRGFTQDDAHIFCMPSQVKEEFEKVIDIVIYVLKALEFHDYTAQISLRDSDNPDKYIGTEENWEKAEKAIVESVNEKGLKSIIEYGEAAFYGPKLDFIVKDTLGRNWQLGTIQLDYTLPERFDLKYKDANNKFQRPVMIHRAPFGSMERFVAILLEHCRGNLPVWLSPVQVKILPISEKFNNDAEKIVKSLKNYEIRCEIDQRNEKVGKKIRDAEISKIPYMIILGEKEIKENKISVRRHQVGDLGIVDLEWLVKEIMKQVSFRR